MSRILKVMVALLAIAAIAAPVMAEDRLSLGGQMRVRGWYSDQDGQVFNAGKVNEEQTGDHSATWADQRLRIGGKLSVAEGVSITFRTDITESDWGTGNTFGSGRGGATQQWDRAHIDLEKNDMHLRAGQQFIKFGKAGFDGQSNGLTFNYKGAIPVTVFYMLYDDGGGKSNSDGYYYGARVAHGTDAYKASVFLVGDNDANDNNVSGLGVTFETKIADMVDFYAEIEGFDGDATGGGDATGMQGYVDASMMLSETVTLGGQFFYADSADSGDTQVVVLGNNFDGWDPLLKVGTGLDNEQIDLGRPYDVFGDGSGFIGGRIYSNFKASDALNLGASFAYGEPETDRTGDNADSLMAFAVGANYDLMANTKLDLQLQYIDEDRDNVDEAFQAGVGLFVNF